MPWIWSCHRCHTRYLLGATRRCLHDGHYFCGGTTVDKVSGKVKKHKACISEFDYTGWEDFGRWKRGTIERIVNSGSKHCEDECDFPSSCHWKEQHAVQETRSGFLHDSCLDKKPDTLPVKSKQTVQNDSENYVGKFRRAAEKHTAQVAKALLAPIEEEGDQKASSCQDTMPKLNGLGLHFPVMDFSSFNSESRPSGEVEDGPQMKLSIPDSPQMSARVENVWEEDVDMTDWITQDATESPPDASEVSFDFRLEQGEEAPASLADDESPISPMRSTWGWTAGGIGIALSPPALPVEDEIWDREMEEEMDDGDALWDQWENMEKT